MRIEPLDRGEPRRPREQAMRNFENVLLPDLQIGSDERVERPSDPPFGRIFDRDYTVHGVVAQDCIEHPLNRRGLAVASCKTEELTGGHVAVRGLRPEK